MSEEKKEKAEKKGLEAVTDKQSFIYTALKGVAQVVFRTLMPVKFHGREKLDRDPPYIMIANHLHALDPIVMAMAVKRHQVVFLGKKELGKNALVRQILVRGHTILVDRHNADMEAMRACMKTIRMKKILVIFPEGTRHHEGQMQQIESGTALIAMRSKSPVVPVYFRSKLRLFHTTHVYFGDPIPYDDLLAEGINADTCEKMNERMRETYREITKKWPPEASGKA